MTIDNLPEGETWCVANSWFGHYIVVGHPDYHGKPAVDCARDALAGDPDAIAAVLMCSEDTVLQDWVRRVNG